MHSGIYSYPDTKRIVYGADFIQALTRELELTGERRVYVLASGTLARTTDAIERVRAALGERCAGVCTRIGAHTPRIDVVAAANAARSAEADLLLGARSASSSVSSLNGLTMQPTDQII